MRLPTLSLPSPPSAWRARLRRAACLVLLLPAWLAGCGGGDGGRAAPLPAASCDVPVQKQWLHDYMRDWYYWADQVLPQPPPADDRDLAQYFDSLLYRGDGAGGPADRWSYLLPTASYDQRFVQGQTLGFGLFVAGLEGLPLKVRHVEPRSPAAAAGIVRGDELRSIDGVSAAAVVAAGDFSALTPAAPGQTLVLDVAGAAGTRQVTLVAETFPLTPVAATALLDLPGGGRAGYLMLKDFISQATAPLADALAGFRAAGATALVVDLRDNGGGLVKVASALASLVVGAAHPGEVFASLQYNARHRDADSRYTLTAGPAPAFGRVIVLTGPRTCSASELLVNGLKPFAQVVTVGAATCGKPFGFVPLDSCGNTFSAVNFETFNAQGQGRYYDGIAADCPVADDFSRAYGDPQEKLTAAALAYLSTGACPAASAAELEQAAAARAAAGARPREPAPWQGMWVDAPGR